MNIVSKETLEFLFMNETGTDWFEFNSFCCNCGSKVKVEVIKTSAGGFGLLGGVLYESDSGTLTVKCLDCDQESVSATQRPKIRHKERIPK